MKATAKLVYGFPVDLAAHPTVEQLAKAQGFETHRYAKGEMVIVSPAWPVTSVATDGPFAVRDVETSYVGFREEAPLGYFARDVLRIVPESGWYLVMSIEDGGAGT